MAIPFKRGAVLDKQSNPMRRRVTAPPVEPRQLSPDCRPRMAQTVRTSRSRRSTLASLAHRNGNSLLDRLLLCRRMAGANRSILLPVVHQRLDIAADDRPARSLLQWHGGPLSLRLIGDWRFRCAICRNRRQRRIDGISGSDVKGISLRHRLGICFGHRFAADHRLLHVVLSRQGIANRVLFAWLVHKRPRKNSESREVAICGNARMPAHECSVGALAHEAYERLPRPRRSAQGTQQI